MRGLDTPGSPSGVRPFLCHQSPPHPLISQQCTTHALSWGQGQRLSAHSPADTPTVELCREVCGPHSRSL